MRYNNHDDRKRNVIALKKWISALLALVFMLTCVGCGSDDFDFSQLVDDASEFTTHSRVTIPSMPSYTYEAATTRTTVTRFTSSSRRTNLTYTTRSTAKSTTRSTTSPTTKPTVSYPTFSSLTSLRDFMTAKKEADVMTFTFKYTGEELKGQLIA